jgi:hypothetical protein
MQAPKDIRIVIRLMIQSGKYTVKGDVLSKYPLDLYATNRLFEIYMDETICTDADITAFFFANKSHADKRLSYMHGTQSVADPNYFGLDFNQATAKAHRERNPETHDLNFDPDLEPTITPVLVPGDFNPSLEPTIEPMSDLDNSDDEYDLVLPEGRSHADYSNRTTRRPFTNVSAWTQEHLLTRTNTTNSTNSSKSDTPNTAE